MTDQTILPSTDRTQPNFSKRFALTCTVITLVAFGLLALRGSKIWSLLMATMIPYGTGILSLVFVGFVAHFIVQRMIAARGADTQSAGTWYRAYFTQLPYRDVVAALVAVILTISSFTLHKSQVVGADGYGFDALFIKWDRMIFAGQDPWRLTHALFSTPSATYWLDFLYHPAFLPMIIGYLACVVARARPALRYTYITAYLASYVVVGMIFAPALHSAGPVYDGILFGDGTTFAPLLDRVNAQSTVAGQFSFLRLQEYLLTLYQMDRAGFGAGISAMPSMHVVLGFLWSFAAWNLNKFFGVVVTAYACLIWVISVHTGWHYFVDGLVGLLLLAVIWRIMGTIFGLYQSKNESV